jgi:hypothetical protein
MYSVFVSGRAQSRGENKISAMNVALINSIHFLRMCKKRFMLLFC